jgi:hypothetical protein
MDPMTAMMVAQAGAGLIKGMRDERLQKEDLRHKAEITRYSPWGPMKPGDVSVRDADVMGSTMQGAASGLATGQNMQAAQNSQKLMDAQVNYLNSRSAPEAGASQGPIMNEMASPAIEEEPPTLPKSSISPRPQKRKSWHPPMSSAVNGAWARMRTS